MHLAHATAIVDSVALGTRDLEDQSMGAISMPPSAPELLIGHYLFTNSEEAIFQLDSR